MKKKIYLLVICFAACIVCVLLFRNSDNTSRYDLNIVSGWNLGNTLDSPDFQRNLNQIEYYETLWGNELTTEAVMIDVKKAGFEAVRIPVTWYDHIEADGSVEKVWMERVREIVDYVLSQDMYCILNVHHDTGAGAICASVSEFERSADYLQELWKQIADTFRDYDERLIFEGFNEILDADSEWSHPAAGDVKSVNRLNQVFVDTVRASGGNNTKRYLLVETYGGCVTEEYLSLFELPKDSTDNRIGVSVHLYMPLAEIEEKINLLDSYFIEKSIPFWVTEIGLVHTPGKEDDREREAYVAKLTGYLRERNIPYFWWDNGKNFENSKEVDNFALLDRTEHRWYFPEIVSILVDKKKE